MFVQNFNHVCSVGKTHADDRWRGVNHFLRAFSRRGAIRRLRRNLQMERVLPRLRGATLHLSSNPRAIPSCPERREMTFSVLDRVGESVESLAGLLDESAIVSNLPAPFVRAFRDGNDLHGIRSRKAFDATAIPVNVLEWSRRKDKMPNPASLAPRLRTSGPDGLRSGTVHDSRPAVDAH